MYCKYCGRQIADDSKFCEYCGNLVGRDRESAVADIPASIGTPIVKDSFFDEPIVAEKISDVTDDVTDNVTDNQIPEVAPEEEPLPEEPEKKSKAGLVWGLIGGGVALLGGLIVLLWALFGGKVTQVNVTSYVDFKVSGYDGYGVATCELDYDGLELAVLGEYPKGSDAKTREKQLEYKEQAVLLRAAVRLEFETVKNVRVGDELTAEITVDEVLAKELDADFGAVRKSSYTVKEKDLSGSSEIDILGEFVDVRFEGLSGNASAALMPKEREKAYEVVSAGGAEYTVTVEMSDNTALSVKFNNKNDNSTELVQIPCSLDKQTEILAGDTVTLSIAEGDKEALMEYGLVIGKLTKEFVAEGLESLVGDFGEIDKKTLASWKKTYGETLEKTAKKHWAHYFHGGNTIASEVKSIEQITYRQGMLMGDGEQNALYLIYSAEVADDAILTENFGLPQTYYFAVKVSNLRLDAKGELMIDKVLLPKNNTDDFIGSFYDIDEVVDTIAEGTEDFVLEN